MHFATFFANIKWQWKSIEAASRDVPVAHVLKPILHSLFGIIWLKFDFFNCLQSHWSDFVNLDKPARNKLINQIGLATPVFIFVSVEKFAVFFESVDNKFNHISGLLASKKTSVFKQNALFVYRADFFQTQSFSKFKVFGTATWRNVNNAASFHLVNFIPSHNLVNKIFFRKFWKTSFIFQANKLRTFKFFQNFDVFLFQNRKSVFAENDVFAFKIDLDIVKFWIDCQGNICRKCPRSGCPCDNLKIFAFHWKFDENCGVFHFMIRRRHFVF